MGIFDGLFGKETSTSTTENLEPRVSPGYEESEGARKEWWETLQEWGDQPGYGAIQPNWDDLWENARGKIRQYYGGGPEGPGAVARMKSSAARSGMGDQPATTRGIARLGMKEGQQLQDVAVRQAMEEAMLSEKGRTGWMSSLQDLAGQKPTLWYPGSRTTKKSGGGEGFDMLGSAMGLLTSALGSGTSSSGGGGYTAPKVSGAMGPYSWFDALNVSEGGSPGGSGTGFYGDWGISGALGDADVGDPFFADQRRI